MRLVDKGINPLVFPGLKLSLTSDDSKLINFDEKPKVIISASGMCEAGRIRHHLKHNLWRRECTVLFVGYQAVGTLGRKLIDGASSVKLFGENIEVSARIESLKGISGHADMRGLLQWLKGFESEVQHVFVVPGVLQVFLLPSSQCGCLLITQHYSTNPHFLQNMELTYSTQIHRGQSAQNHLSQYLLHAQRRHAALQTQILSAIVGDLSYLQELNRSKELVGMQI